MAAHQMVRYDPIGAIDRARPLTTLSLPEWLLRSLSALKADYSPARIPESIAPNETQTVLILKRIADLERAESDRSVDKAMVRLTEMLASFGAQAMSEKTATMRARGYLTALDDLPWWAVEEACRMWLRGEAGEANYSFAPSPPQLRAVAVRCAERVTMQRKALVRLLNAQIEREYSLEHRGEMLARLGELFRSIGATLTTKPSQRQIEAAAKRESVLSKQPADGSAPA